MNSGDRREDVRDTASPRSEALPMISVIVPVYNVERYLDQCVRSIVNQTYTNLQIILIDDKSPDRCPQMCDDWARRDPRIVVIHHQRNQGLASSRNSGLAAATGALVGFVDSDDWIASDMYMSMYINMRNSHADVACTASYHAFDDGRISNRHVVSDVRFEITNSESFKYVNLPGYFGVAAWDKLIKKEFLGSEAFCNGVRRSEDYYFTYRLLSSVTNIVYDSTPKYYYRMRSDSLSNESKTIDKGVVEETRKMVDLVEREYPEQLPYALYGHLIAMMGTYDQAIMSRQASRAMWKDLKRDIRSFIRRNGTVILRTVPVSRGRKLQMHIFRFSPWLYASIFRMYKVVRPWRSA
ncbi:MAG: glycosyltransferase family 2 protein [Bifidobacterium minimum]|jgi:glycosyltransferase involved in cell wall biosynthesis|nr:glycosyltransferase family 2 protein [Bifidobacterium minimum]